MSTVALRSRKENNRVADLAKQRLHGTRRGPDGKRYDTRAEAKNVPTPPALSRDSVQPPKWMKPKHVGAFNHMLDTLSYSDVATIMDSVAAEMLCSTYANYLEISEILGNDGLTVEVPTKDGDFILRPHPLLAERGRIFTSLRNMLSEFGLTPSSRRAVEKRTPTSADTPEDEEWDEFLN